jgi:DNA polymerase-3 subunit delta'
MEILPSKEQLSLFGYEKYFSSFVKLYKKKKIPNVLLINGPKGSGKSTFVYHYINYLLSINEKNSYSLENFKINENNSSFRKIQNNIHPNFFSIDDNLLNKNIKIDQIRGLKTFLSKTTYEKNIKIIFIDNVENLNIFSSNALLKSLEEPNSNTFFFMSHDNSTKLLNTVKSRCLSFKINFNIEEKKNIFKEIARDYQFNFTENNLDKFLFFDTPGNFLKYLLILKDSKLDISQEKLLCIYFMLEKYKLSKDPNFIKYISLFIESFYNDLSMNNHNNINYYFHNKNKILYIINDMIKFNLDKKNLIFSVKKILSNEK